MHVYISIIKLDTIQFAVNCLLIPLCPLRGIELSPVPCYHMNLAILIIL